MRLDVLRQKDETNQSAVARCLILLIFNLIVLYFDLILTKRDEKHLSYLSPEVKRRLQEVILQRKRKEAASSMGNLQVIIQNNQTEEQTNKENKQNSQTNKQTKLNIYGQSSSDNTKQTTKQSGLMFRLVFLFHQYPLLPRPSWERFPLALIC